MLIDIKEVSKLTGMPVSILIQMRARETRTLLSGPPVCKILDARGNTQYTYKKTEVLKWLKRRKFRITGGDAAAILGIPRQELFARYGSSQHSWEGRNGQLVIKAGKNIFIWVPKLALGEYGLKKAA